MPKRNIAPKPDQPKDRQFAERSGEQVIAITGVAGFVGGAIACSLIKSGYSIIGIDRNHAPAHLPFLEYHRDDIGQTAVLQKTTSRIDCLVHVAANVHGGGILNIARDNLFATWKLFRQAKALGISKAIFISSAAVFNAVPNGEIVTERTRPCPRTI